MLLECSSCAKMYRVREGAANPPKSCPACQGALRPAGGGAPAPSGGGEAENRQKELEAKLAAAERELTAVKASTELKDKELQEAQASIARLGADLEKAQATYREALQKKEQELEAAQSKARESEAEGTKVRQAASAQTMALLKAKDEALRKAQDRIAELEGAASAPAVPSAELEEARRSIALLGEDLAKAQAAYKEALKKKDDEIEELHRKIAAAPAGGGKPAGPPDAELQRALARASGLEKIIQDGERRYTALQRQMEALQEKGQAGAEKALQDRVKELESELEAARRDYTNLKEEKAAVAPPAAPAASHARLPQDLKARIGEARYLSADLDRMLASVTSSLTGLVERMKRLDGTLQSIPTELLSSQEASGDGEAGEKADGADGEEAVEFTTSEPPPSEPEAAPELSASEEEGVQPLESLPDPEPSPEGALPQDETLLDMGSRSAPSDDAPAGDAPPEGEPGSGERPTRRGSRIRPRDMDKKKSGFFGKLFGKK